MKEAPVTFHAQFVGVAYWMAGDGPDMRIYLASRIAVQAAGRSGIDAAGWEAQQGVPLIPDWWWDTMREHLPMGGEGGK